MGKRIYSISVFLLIVSACLFATDPRQMVLGNYVDDENDILTNPALAWKYGSFVKGEIVTGNDWAMANYMLKDDLSLGMHLGRQEGAIYTDVFPSTVSKPFAGIGLFLSKALIPDQEPETSTGSWGDTGYISAESFGLGVYAANKRESLSETDEEDTTQGYDQSAVYGVIAGFNSDMFSLSAGMNYNREHYGTYWEYLGDDVYEFYTSYEYFSELKLKFNVSEESRIKGIAKFRRFEVSRKTHDPELEDTQSENPGSEYTFVSAGTHYQKTIGRKGVLSTGLTFSLTRTKTVSESGYYDWPITLTETWCRLPTIEIGVEIPIMDRTVGKSGIPLLFMARGGAEKTWAYYSEEDDRFSYMTTQSTFGIDEDEDFVSFGLGLSVASFLVDMTISETLLQSGPYIISGRGETMTYNMTLGYRF